MRFAVEDKQRVAAGAGRVRSSAVRRKLYATRGGAHRNARGDLIRARVHDPQIPAGDAGSPDLRASGVGTDAGRLRADINASDSAETYEVDYGERTACRGHIGMQFQPGP